MRLQAVVFDIGGVVIRTPFELVPMFERRLSLPAGTLRWYGPLAANLDIPWQAVIDGTMTERSYWQARASEVDWALKGDDELGSLMAGLFDLPYEEVIRPELPALLDSLDEAGIAMAALTNDLLRFHGREWIKGLALLGRFEPLIDLSLGKVLKPDPAAFAGAVTRLGLKPGQVLMVDDQPANIAGAHQAGMQTMFFDVRHPAAAVEAVLALF
jgi:FMN phosphatase YigB (HAD superfamily)